MFFVCFFLFQNKEKIKKRSRTKTDKKQRKTKIKKKTKNKEKTKNREQPKKKKKKDRKRKKHEESRKFVSSIQIFFNFFKRQLIIFTIIILTYKCRSKSPKPHHEGVNSVMERLIFFS